MMRRNTPRMSPHKDIDTCLIANEGPRGDLDNRTTYPDFDDRQCWVLTGTWGAYGVEVRGRNLYEDQRRFVTPSDAVEFYTRELRKTPVERESWGFGPDRGGRWGLRFRGSRPESVPVPPALKPMSNPETPRETAELPPLKRAYLQFIRSQPNQRIEYSEKP